MAWQKEDDVAVVFPSGNVVSSLIIPRMSIVLGDTVGSSSSNKRLIVIKRGLYPAASAIWDVVKNLLSVIWRIHSLVEEGRFRTTLCVAGGWWR